MIDLTIICLSILLSISAFAVAFSLYLLQRNIARLIDTFAEFNQLQAKQTDTLETFMASQSGESEDSPF